MSVSEDLASLFHRDLTRLIQQVRAFPDDSSLWKRSGTMNSAGNLLLHLEGNLREYIGRQLGGVPYQRERDQEFSLSDVPAAEIARRLEEVREIVDKTLRSLSEEQLRTTNPDGPLGKPVTNALFLVHLYGHLGYHMGQIDYSRRILASGSSLAYAAL